MRRSDLPFDQLFIDEVKALCNLLKPNANDAFRRVGEMKNGSPPAQEDILPDDKLQDMIDLIVRTFILKRNADFFPGIAIIAGLDAAIRCSRDRAFTKNDFDDIRHAAIALPFADYFFTENSLCHLLTTKPLQYDRKYSVQVVSKPEQVLAVLRRDF